MTVRVSVRIRRVVKSGPSGSAGRNRTCSSFNNYLSDSFTMTEHAAFKKSELIKNIIELLEP